MKHKIAAIFAAALAGIVLAATTLSGSAAPITCPGGQSATKTADGWDCVNNGGNETGAERPKGGGPK
jgi:hypothetical protein